jgi:hypothetical protein
MNQCLRVLFVTSNAPDPSLTQGEFIDGANGLGKRLTALRAQIAPYRQVL